MTTKLNGVNIDQLAGTINAIKDRPELAKFTFRANTEWVNGGHCRTSIQSFFGAGNEDSSRTAPFVLEGGEPPVLLGENNGPNAVEYALHALTSCLTVGFVYNAAAQGIKVDELSFEIKVDMDLQGFLGLSREVRPGYQNIDLTCRVKADVPQDKLDELWEYVQRTSPVLDIIKTPINVRAKLEAM